MSASGPFAVLGLDPATCDAAAIKAAYARLVKAHRPDRDPAGFRRVRDAYEFCVSPAGAACMAAGQPEVGPTEARQRAAPPGAVAEPDAARARPAGDPDDFAAMLVAWERTRGQPPYSRPTSPADRVSPHASHNPFWPSPDTLRGLAG